MLEKPWSQSYIGCALAALFKRAKGLLDVADRSMSLAYRYVGGPKGVIAYLHLGQMRGTQCCDALLTVV